ncbi:MAG: GNAT family N-acetyltransferase [Actinomycetota bacterium]
MADLIDRCGALGGRRAGDGVNLLLPDGVPSPSDEPGANGRGDGLSVRWLDSSDPDDLALVRAFVESCPAEDVDEADIFVDQPDPVICVFVDDRDTIAAYASGRAFWAAAGFDDIGVLVRPDHRGVGLGAAVVHEFAAARCGTASQLYRHDVENVGSAGVARAVGFVELHRVHAFDFAD